MRTLVLLFLVGGVTPAAAQETEAPPAAAPAAAPVVASGQWVKDQYDVTGGWHIEREGDRLVLVIHPDFTTTRGPDLKLYLHPSPMQGLGGKDAVKAGVQIAALKSHKGAQRYTLPAGTDLADYKSVLIVCKAFKKLWGGGAL